MSVKRFSTSGFNEVPVQDGLNYEKRAIISRGIVSFAFSVNRYAVTF